MGNWCAVLQEESDSHLPLNPGHIPRVLAVHSGTVIYLQSCIRTFLLRAKLHRQLSLLPILPDSDPYTPVSSPNSVLPALSTAANTRKCELSEFNYDLPILCVIQKPAVCLSDQSVYKGEWHHSKRYGQGVCHKDGGILEGYWVNGLLHYQGRIIYANGSSYDGGFDMMRRHGHGVYVSGDGEEIYNGEWEYGVKHGKAKEILGGVIYIGWFDKGERTGTNVELEWPNGDRYVGSMVKGKKHGRGKYVWSNQEEYEGDWKEDIQEGTGRWTREQDEYAGGFKDGVRQGRGVLRWGKYEYEGEFDAGTMHGEGWLTISCGCRRLFRFNRNHRGLQLSTDTHQPLQPI